MNDYSVPIKDFAGEASGLIEKLLDGGGLGVASRGDGWAAPPPGAAGPTAAQDVAKRPRLIRTTLRHFINSEPLLAAAMPHSIDPAGIGL